MSDEYTPEDTEDLALTFIETEVGRHDWARNWCQIRDSGTAIQRIQRWLDVMQIDHDPKLIEQHLNDLCRYLKGAWR